MSNTIRAARDPQRGKFVSVNLYRETRAERMRTRNHLRAMLLDATLWDNDAVVTHDNRPTIGVMLGK